MAKWREDFNLILKRSTAKPKKLRSEVLFALSRKRIYYVERILRKICFQYKAMFSPSHFPTHYDDIAKFFSYPQYFFRVVLL